MKIKYIQVVKGCIAFILTIACLYVVQAVWQSYAVGLPLDKALSNIDGVQSVVLNDHQKINSRIAIYVTLNNTANLQKTHKEISKKIEQTLYSSKYTLEIKDNRSPELEQLYYDIHFYIQKAIADGDFPLLEAKAQEKAHLIKADAKVYVDRQKIYLQLLKDDASLYSVVTR